MELIAISANLRARGGAGQGAGVSLTCLHLEARRWWRDWRTLSPRAGPAFAGGAEARTEAAGGFTTCPQRHKGLISQRR